MFFLAVSLFSQIALLSLSNSSWLLALSGFAMVLGRPELSSVTYGAFGVMPAVVNRFIDLKVYGFFAGYIGMWVSRFIGFSGFKKVSQLTIVIIFLSALHFICLFLLNSVYFWLVLTAPLSVAITLLITFGPLLLLFNITSCYRILVSLFLFWIGVRDPFVDPGDLARLVVRLLEIGGPRLARLIDASGVISNFAIIYPLQVFLGGLSKIFVPDSFRLETPSRLFYSRVSWSVSFFLFSILDFEVVIYVLLALAGAAFFWGLAVLKSLLGIETVLDILVPTFIAFSTETLALAFILVSDSYLWFIGGVIERSGVVFEPIGADGVALKIHDRASFLEAPPTVRRDITLGYMSFSGIPRLVFGLVTISLFMGLSWFLLTMRVIKGRLALLPVRILRAGAFAMIPFTVPSNLIDIGDEGVRRFWALAWPFASVIWEDGYLWIRFLYPLLGWIWIHATTVPDLQFPSVPERPVLSTLFFEKLLSLTRRSTLKLVEKLNGVRLPEFVSNVYEPPSLESVTRAYQLLVDVGFPVTDQLLSDLKSGMNDPTASSYLAEHGSWKRWFLGSISTKLGYPKLKVGTHSWLPSSFYEVFPGYLHVASWNSEEAEVKSTGRYWTNNEAQTVPDGSEPLIDDLWSAVKAQYRHSRLATFSEIYSNWVKRFNMGFGFTKEVNGKVKQLTRNEVIQIMGGKWKFLEAWERIFNRGLGLHMPAPVFAKYESLKPKKALEGVVRTIVGSPFVHHVMTTIFNYHPNHNYKVWETPMKVGMPINGQNYNRLWELMMRHDKVWAGDMTAFDSQVSPAIVRVIAAIRKAGYDDHRDRNKICELIDLSYEALIQQPMGFKNIGDLAWKNQGFTTGHSSTSADNSLALVANYLFAWRRVTGLRAREFFNYNTLANFGDDHILGYDPVFGWCPERMIAAMKELGTIMRDEAPGEDKMPAIGVDFNNLSFAFLAKVPVPLDGKVLSELQAAGVDVPLTYATAHVRSRLLGKVKGEGLKSKITDPVRSYTALISYIYMTAHHRDIYLQLVRQAQVFYANHHETWVKAGLIDKPNRADRLPRPPSYNKVLRQWYSKEPFPYSLEEPEEDGDAKFYIHLQDDVLAAIVRWAADVPTMLSPRYINTRWADWLQVKLAWVLNWPLSFVAMANQLEGDARAAKTFLTKTPYAFLRNDALVPSVAVPFGVLHTRHLLYISFSRLLGVRRTFSVLDLLRLADSTWANLVFFFTGQVTTVAIELDLHIIDTLLIALLSFVSWDLGTSPLVVDMLSPSLVFARFVSAGLRLITPSGAIDYQPLDAQIQQLILDASHSFTLAAPTGTGKSTRMMMRISSMLPSGMKMVVIQPRHLVAVGVGEYMKKIYPTASIGISTEGYRLDGTEKLIYATAQSFLLNPALRARRDVWIVLDEAHLDEPMYIVMRRLMLTNPSRRRILVTATPTPDILQMGLTNLAVPAVNQNKVIRINHQVKSLGQFVNWGKQFVDNHLPVEKILIFLPSIAAALEMKGAIPRRVCVLNSKSTEVDEHASVFIATSVADAGLTLPDVAFVLSMDYDVRVTVPDEDFRPKLSHSADDSFAKTGFGARPYFFKLSETTITQRMGRTGRTLDGYFHFFEVTDVKTEEVEYTLSDFANGCSPASQFASTWFPKALVNVQPYFKPFTVVWDEVPGTSWTRFSAWKDRFLGTESPTPAKFKQWLLDNMEQIKTLVSGNVIFALDADQAPPLFGDGDVGPCESDDDDLPPPNITMGWRRPGSDMARQGVSGAGLLCGVRAVLGVIWSCSDHRPTFDEVYAMVVQHTDETVVQDPTRNFHALPLQYAAWFGWRVAITIEFDDLTAPIPPSRTWDTEVAIHGTIYQQINHYEYLGYPLPASAFS